MTQRWFEIAMEVSPQVVDEAAALLDFAGFGGVEVRDRGAMADVVVVVETGADDDELDDKASAAFEAIEILHAGPPRIAELDPKVWTENWKQHFARRTFANRIEVRPPWEDATDVPGIESIVINPGMAFGTGLHETTAGCLELLVENVRPGMRVADVGCGSGILAIAAARLGASEVIATDVDPLAVEATRENIAANGVEAVVHVELEPGEVGVPEWEHDARPGLSAARHPLHGENDARTSDDAAARHAAGLTPVSAAESANFPRENDERPVPNGATSGGFSSRGAGAFDLVVANILAETLVEMRDALCTAVRRGGTLLLSGIEARRLKTVEEAFIRSPWCAGRTITRGDWISLSLHHEVLAEPAQRASTSRDHGRS